MSHWVKLMKNKQHICLVTEGNNVTGILTLEDIFEEMQAKNREPFVADILFYNYYGWNEQGEWAETIYKLSDAEIAAIVAVFKSEPLQLGDGVYIATDWECGLIEATDDMLFRHSGPSIAKAGNSYYVSAHKDSGATTYLVPTELNPIFDKITAAFLSEFNYGEIDYTDIAV